MHHPPRTITVRDHSKTGTYNSNLIPTFPLLYGPQASIQDTMDEIERYMALGTLVLDNGWYSHSGVYVPSDLWVLRAGPMRVLTRSRQIRRNALRDNAPRHVLDVALMFMNPDYHPIELTVWEYDLIEPNDPNFARRRSISVEPGQHWTYYERDHNGLLGLLSEV